MKWNEKEEYLIFKKVDQSKLTNVTMKANAVIRHIETDDVIQTKLLWQQPFGLQKKLEWGKTKEERKMSHGGKEELKWYYHLRTNIKRLKKERRGETGAMGKIKIKELNTKYRLKKKGINMVIEELKEGLIANKTKIKRYEQTMSQFRQI